MKLLVVSLALTIFTGSQAFILRGESNSKLDQLLRQVTNYVLTGLDNKFTKIMQMVENSETGEALESWLRNQNDKAEQRWKALKDALPPEVKEIERQAPSAYGDLERKVANDLRAIRSKGAPALEALYRALESDLNPILEKLDPYIQPLGHRLANTNSQLGEKVDELLKWQMEKLQPHTKEIRIWLQEVQDSLERIADQGQKFIVSEVEKAYNVLQWSAARILKVVQDHREGFDQWVHAPLFPEDH